MKTRGNRRMRKPPRDHLHDIITFFIITYLILMHANLMILTQPSSHLNMNPSNSPDQTQPQQTIPISTENPTSTVNPPNIENIEEAMRNFNIRDPNFTPQPVLSQEALHLGAQQWSFSLTGKIIAEDEIETGKIRASVRIVWRMFGNVSVIKTGSNLFVFRFSDQDMVDRVISGAPWALDGYLVILQQWHPSFQPTESDFIHQPFWIEMKNLQPEFLVTSNLTDIASTVGIPLLFDPANGVPITASRVRVFTLFNINTPMIKGMYVNKHNGGEAWVKLYYEKQPKKICKRCFVLNHKRSECEIIMQNLIRLRRFAPDPDNDDPNPNQHQQHVNVNPIQNIPLARQYMNLNTQTSATMLNPGFPVRSTIRFPVFAPAVSPLSTPITPRHVVNPPNRPPPRQMSRSRAQPGIRIREGTNIPNRGSLPNVNPDPYDRKGKRVRVEEDSDGSNSDMQLGPIRPFMTGQAGPSLIPHSDVERAFNFNQEIIPGINEHMETTHIQLTLAPLIPEQNNQIQIQNETPTNTSGNDTLNILVNHEEGGIISVMADNDLLSTASFSPPGLENLNQHTGTAVNTGANGLEANLQVDTLEREEEPVKRQAQ